MRNFYPENIVLHERGSVVWRGISKGIHIVGNNHYKQNMVSAEAKFSGTITRESAIEPDDSKKGPNLFYLLNPRS